MSKHIYNKYKRQSVIIFQLYPQNVEVPRPGIEPVPQQQPKPLQGQSRILNPQENTQENSKVLLLLTQKGLL